MFTEERARWLYSHYRWLEEHLPPRDDKAPRVLIAPTPQYYPMRNTRDHAFASAVFDQTRAWLGLSTWPCRLVPRRDDHEEEQAALRRAGLFGESRSHGAAGTFQAAEEVEITYATTLLNDPVGLVATLAHELCHYLLAHVATEPPAGWDELEPLTDLTAVVEGFGIFLANSSFSFGQWTDTSHQGWQARTQGYLNTAELGFALAVFCTRNGTPPELPAKFLKPNPRQVFVDSLDYIADLER
ncbi:MAG: hypothetical protein IAE82_13315 [Opitutaceae bacterium]|nr:hypothetical protein [Opitutaceae bacterium]